MLDARPDFKQDYRNDWVYANAREYFVLSLLNRRLPGLFESHKAWAEPAGHGAFNPGVVEGWHSGALDKFDIVVKIDGVPCCFVEVSGVNNVIEMDRPELGLTEDDYCVGSWKLNDARKHGILDRTWFAFVILDSKSVRFLYAKYLGTLVSGEYPGLKTAVLRRGEGPSYCLDKRMWKPLRNLLNWIKNRGLAYALAEKVLLEEMEKLSRKDPGRPDPW